MALEMVFVSHELGYVTSLEVAWLDGPFTITWQKKTSISDRRENATTGTCCLKN
jgi:hypothetical protein